MRAATTGLARRDVNRHKVGNRRGKSPRRNWFFMEPKQQAKPEHPVPLCAVGSRIQAGIFLTVLCAYLIGESRTQPYNDSRMIYSVAESIVYRGTIDIAMGVNTHAQQPLLASAIHIPGAALRWAITKSHPELDPIVKPLTSHLGSELISALGCLLFFRFLLYLGVSFAAASLATVGLAFGTFLPIYARTAWSEACQTTCFIGFFSALIRMKDDPRRKTGLWFGIWAGLLINSKYVFALCLPGSVLFLAVYAWRRKQVRPVAVASAWSALAGAFFLATLLWYNWARTGSITNTGYPTVEKLSASVFAESMFVGLWSFFFSFGKSIFFYAPPLVLTVLGLGRFVRTRAPLAWAILLTGGPVVCLYSKFAYWSGDWCWGPRYLLFLVPILLIPATFLVDEMLAARRRIALAACGVLLLIGFTVQVAGASQYWDFFIRFSKGAQFQWLGNPNRAGAFSKGAGSCDPCFEDFYARNYTPAFQPIEYQWWFLKHHIRSHPWAVASQDIPSRRYTNLEMAGARQWYESPVWDWWKLDFDVNHKTAGDCLLTLFTLGLLTGLLLWLFEPLRPLYQASWSWVRRRRSA
jgi:hypothetical protein